MLLAIREGGGVKPACRDDFARIGLVEKEELTYSVLCWLVTSPRPLREGVNVLGWLVTIPHPLREGEQSCLSRVAKATNAGEGSKQGFILLVTFPHPLRERVEFLSELCELRNSGVGLNQELTPTAPLCSVKLFSDTLSLCSRYRFENLPLAAFRLNLASLTSPHPLREREQSCLSRVAKATNAGVGVTQEHLQSAPLCEGKVFSDTLPLCSRYRFENLPFAPFRLNLASVVFPRHPIPECVMLNLFQHLTGLACDLPSCKILNSSKIEWETNTHNNIIKTDFLRFQDDNACTSPRPLSIQLRKDHSRQMCHVILSPTSIQGRRISKTLI